MDYIAYFIIGVLIINGLPHFIQGICGNAFQTPFAKPIGIGKSSPVVNVLWGTFNFFAAYALFYFVGWIHCDFNLPIICLIGGAFICALFLSVYFSKVRNADY